MELMDLPAIKQVDRYNFEAVRAIVQATYYTEAMMLATLFPEYAAEFGNAGQRTTKKMSRDPLIMHYGPDEPSQDIGGMVL